MIYHQRFRRSSLGLFVSSGVLVVTGCGVAPAGQASQQTNEQLPAPEAAPVATEAPPETVVDSSNTSVPSVTDEFGDQAWLTSESPILTYLGVPNGEAGFKQLEVIHHDRIAECMSVAGFTYIPPLTVEAQDSAFEENEKLTLEERKAFDEALNAFSTESPDDGCFATTQTDVFPGQALRDELISAGDLLMKCLEDSASTSECARYEEIMTEDLVLGSDEFIRVSEIVVIDQDREAVDQMHELIDGRTS